MQTRNINNEGERRKGLIIAVSDYHDKQLGKLDFCQKDGEEIHGLLKSLGYEIADNHRLVGKVSYEALKKAIKEFFTNKNIKSKDTLLFYFSGHGIAEDNGEHYLAASDIEPEEPFDKGYSFDDLQKMLNRSVSRRIVVILDCCYSGAAKPGKGGNGEEAATLGREAINNKIKSGEGKCLLASSLSFQKSYATKEEGHSIFTHYLIDGLKGNRDSVNSDGTITSDSLGRYVYDKVTQKLPKQRPIKKSELSGDIILAEYPELARSEQYFQDTAPLMDEGERRFSKNEYKKAIEYYNRTIAISPNYPKAYYRKGLVLSKLQSYDEAILSFNKAIELNPNYDDAWYEKGNTLINLGKREEAVSCYDKAMDINPRHVNALNHKRVALDIIESNRIQIPQDTKQTKATINIDDIQCSEDGKGIVHIKFNISGINHGSNATSFGVKVYSSAGEVVHNANIPVPRDAPNPATTNITFNLGLNRGTYSLYARINDEEISKIFETPDCSIEA